MNSSQEMFNTDKFLEYFIENKKNVLLMFS